MEHPLANVLEKVMQTADKDTRLALMAVLFKELVMNPNDYLKDQP